LPSIQWTRGEPTQDSPCRYLDPLQFLTLRPSKPSLLRLQIDHRSDDNHLPATFSASRSLQARASVHVEPDCKSGTVFDGGCERCQRLRDSYYSQTASSRPAQSSRPVSQQSSQPARAPVRSPTSSQIRSSCACVCEQAVSPTGGGGRTTWNQHQEPLRKKP
jgi:hypothetical protein